MKYTSIFFLAILMLAGVTVRAIEPGDEILGIWNTTDNKSQVQVFKEKQKYSRRYLV